MFLELNHKRSVANIMSNEEKLKNTLRYVMKLLVAGDDKTLERISGGQRLSEEEIAGAINELDDSPVMPPEVAFDSFFSIADAADGKKQWYANVDLWTAEEGRTDMTLELTINENGKQIYDIEIDNIHMM